MRLGRGGRMGKKEQEKKGRVTVKEKNRQEKDEKRGNVVLVMTVC